MLRGILQALLVAVAVAAATVALAPSSTDHGLIACGPVGRTVRRLRSAVVRTLAAITGWPHAVDRLLGAHRTPVACTPSDVMLRLGSATISRYRGARRGEPVLLVHSLVTRPWILDLAPGHSLAAALVDAGFDVFLLDWGDPGPGEALLGFDDHVRLLALAEDHVLQVTGESHVHVVGYCAGGTLALVRSAVLDDAHLGSLTVIAAPVDCTAPGGMSRVLASRVIKPVLALDGDGCVPAAAIRETFHLLSPRALRSVWHGLRVRRDPVAWHGHSALARWVWEQRRLGGALLFDTVRMIRDNTVVEVLRDGRSGAEARRRARGLERLPVLACVAERDHVVPPAMTLAITGVEGLRVDVLQCRGGHVSMLSGSRAGRSLWSDLATWLRARGAGDEVSLRGEVAARHTAGHADRREGRPGDGVLERHR
jgi:polyhydroxyalkanoate synthase subunit PhaC